MAGTNIEPLAAGAHERGRLQALVDLCQGGATDNARLVTTDGREYEIPETVLRLLSQTVHALVHDEAVSIVPVRKELTTQDAADLLNVSRQYLVRLLDRGDVPSHKVGTHRRIVLSDLLEYKQRRDCDQQAGLAELAQLSQELGLYDRG